MRKLADQIGVQAPSSDYVKGRIVDNQTLISEAINGDIVEFFHKMAGMATITENGLPENTTNGHQLILALKYLIEQYSKVANQGFIIWRSYDIGTWDMNSVGNKKIDIDAFSGYKVSHVSAVINQDEMDVTWDINHAGDIYIEWGTYPVVPAKAVISARPGEYFAINSRFNGTVINRGVIIIGYTPV